MRILGGSEVNIQDCAFIVVILRLTSISSSFCPSCFVWEQIEFKVVALNIFGGLHDQRGKSIKLFGSFVSNFNRIRVVLLLNLAGASFSLGISFGFRRSRHSWKILFIKLWLPRNLRLLSVVSI